MLGVVEDLRRGCPVSTTRPAVHDEDAVGDVGDDAEVVGDQDHRQAPLAVELLEQAQDLRLDRDVERGGRLVGDQHSGSSESPIAIIARWRMPPENSCG